MAPRVRSLRVLRVRSIGLGSSFVSILVLLLLRPRPCLRCSYRSGLLWVVLGCSGLSWVVLSVLFRLIWVAPGVLVLSRVWFVFGRSLGCNQLDRKTSKPDSAALSRFLFAVRSCVSRGRFQVLGGLCVYCVGVLWWFAVRVLGLVVLSRCAVGFCVEGRSVFFLCLGVGFSTCE